MECKSFSGLNYWVYTPQNPRKGLPLVTFLHGIGERGSDPENVCRTSLPKWLREGRWTPDAWVICPQCPDGMDWHTQAEKLKAVIDHEIEELEADKDRVSITGLSMGGYGTWSMAVLYPDMFSAIAPVCGGGSPGRAKLLTHLPVWAFHGAQDDVVPLHYSVDMVDGINKVGGNARLTIFHTLAHNSWDEAYGTTNVLDWLLEQSRKAK